MSKFSETDREDERFRLAVEAALNGMVMVNGDGEIVLVNSHAEKLFGYAGEELLGQAIEILLPELHRSSHVTTRDSFFVDLKARTTASGLNLHARRKDGRQFPVEIGLNPIETADGTWVLASIVDMSESKREQENFRMAVEASPNAIAVVDHEGKIALVNSRVETLFGYSSQELLGQAIEVLVPKPQPRNQLILLEGSSSQAFVQPIGSGLFLEGRRKSGSLFPVEISLSPIETVEGTWLLHSIVDITFHRQKLESVGLLASGIAHDFNNLLGSVLADTDLALAELGAGSQPTEEIRNIQKVAIRAAEIVRQLMIYAGQEMVRSEPVDISWLVEEMVELLKVSISKHAFLKTELANDLPRVLGNAPQLRQVVMNLIINASEAIDGEGVIEVSTSQVRGGRNLAPNDPAELPEGDYVRLEVSDTGRGMTVEQQTRIFDRFVTIKFPGRGLGLSVVQGIVRAHGGAINLVSAPGLGTTFQILLPCIKRVKREDIALSHTRGTQIAGVAKTVLLVEDEDTLRQPVSKILRRSGFAVLEAADGSDAIRTFRSQSTAIDLIVLDLTIPGASSLEVLNDARRIRPDTKVILTSAYSQDMVKFPPDAPKVSGYIRKPFQPSELVHLIREVLFVECVRLGTG